MLYSRKICGGFLLAQARVASGTSIRTMALYWSALPVGAASGIFDAVLKHFLSSVVPEYVPSTFLVLAINAPTISRRVASPILQIK